MAGGRPVKYKTPEEMQVLIDAYFERCESTYGTENPIYPTVTGLAIALDLTRTGLLEYCDKSTEFSNTIKAGKARVEHFIEQRLYSGQATGCIFNLKNNFGWKDSQDINNTHTFVRMPSIKIGGGEIDFNVGDKA